MKEEPKSLEERITRNEERLIAAKTALEVSQVTMKELAQAMEKRLDGMNEFRATLKDQATTFITKSEFEHLKEYMSIELRNLNEFKAVAQSRASQSSVWITLSISMIGLMISLLSYFKP